MDVLTSIETLKDISAIFFFVFASFGVAKHMGWMS